MSATIDPELRTLVEALLAAGVRDLLDNAIEGYELGEPDPDAEAAAYSALAALDAAAVKVSPARVDAGDPRCQAVKDREDVTRRLAGAFGIPLEPLLENDADLGSEKAMLVVFSVLHGIVNEYINGGDQMAEACTCGGHVNYGPDPS